MNEQEDQLEGVSEKENMEDGPTESSDSTNGEGGENTLEQEIAELKNKYLRLYSDFENFRKRTSKERLDLISTASEEVLRDLIPVVDDFERALKASENEKDASKVGEGNHLIFQKLIRILKSKGLVPMDDLIGKPFDADTQEAITQIPAPTKELKGKVVDVVEKGYTLGDKVVRFAKVVIGA
ncbi:MAG: nucleotide exchange factor GrpE [Algoriphagus sp.]|uniref:nucleotide exchange factor GrpE n=1 Tax=Algoriphagus sp. TaxID=1872435 RepID=UPI002606F9A7|nr:nucleotide exchange factor GrpE [Algoriphagus sp.]MDG1279511.1 nucleotide exchange factor GrpE [Algoriphagus sp.]